MSNAPLLLLDLDPTTWGVPPAGKTFVGLDLNGQLVTKNAAGAITTIFNVPGITAYLNAGGNTTVVTASVNDIAVVTISGAARTVPIVLSTPGIQDGQQLRVRVNFPTIDNLIVNFYNQVTTNPVLSSFQASAGSGIGNGFWTFYAQGGIWVLLANQVPAAS